MVTTSRRVEAVDGEYAAETLALALARSVDLGTLIRAAWESTSPADAPRSRAVQGLCFVSLDHGAAVLALLPAIPVSGIALIRPQYESLVRAVWAAYAATDAELDRLSAPLTQDSQQAAKQLPGVPQMLAALETVGPRGAAALLGRARLRLGDGLNSFIHGGIHPVARQRDGYPVALLLDIVKNTNGLSMLTLVVLANFFEHEEFATLLSSLHDAFAGVLPPLEPL